MEESGLAVIHEYADYSEDTPLILIHDGGGTIFNYCCLECIGRNLFAIANPKFDEGGFWNGGIPQVAQAYCDLVKARFSGGQVLLGGYCFGALVALEMSKQLASDADVTVAGLILIETPYPGAPERSVNIASPSTPDQISSSQQLGEKIEECIRNADKMIASWQLPTWDMRKKVLDDKPAQQSDFQLTSLPPAVLLRAEERVLTAGNITGDTAYVDIYRENPLLGWENYPNDFIIEVHTAPGHHFSVFSFEHVDEMTSVIATACDLLSDLER